MRPDDRRASMAWSAGNGGEPPEPPLDADLAALGAELDETGAHARRGLSSRAQPTRVFAANLRSRLVGAYAAPVAAATGAGPAAPGAANPRESLRAPRLRAELAVVGETWAPTPLEPRLVRRTPTVLPRARWALLAAAALTGVLAAGALGARIDWLFPSPTAETSLPPASPPTTSSRPSPAATAAAAVPVASARPAAEPTTSATQPPGTAPVATRKPTPTPTPTPKPAPTTKPQPTVPPVGSIDLAVKACPGGVVLDWTKYSIDTSHYHVLRSLTGDVPATYPADGTTEIETATSFDAVVTDGFDAGLGGGKTATYRAFAFDGADEVVAYSPSRTVTAVGAIPLGALGVENLGPGSISVSWLASDVSAACFTYGKLVASAEDPEPSYLKGSPYLVAIGDPASTGVTLDGLPSGTTVWMRYEKIRVTSLGKFVVARSDVLQVTYP